MRRVMVTAVTVSLLFALAVPVSAGRPTTESFDFLSFDCGLSGDAGSGFVSVFVENDFADAHAEVWLPESDPFEEEPDLFSDFDGVQVSVVGEQVSATIPMISAETGDPHGDLVLSATIGAVIDEETFSDRFRDGNRWVESTETLQFHEATADVSLDGAPFDAFCSATQGQVERRSTNPHAFRIDFKDASVNCFGIVGSDGSVLNLFAGEFEREASIFLEIFPPGSEENDFFFEPPELFGSAELPRLSGNINVTVPLFDPFEEEPVTEAAVSMTIDEGEVVSSRIVFQHGRVKAQETELIVSGAVELDDGPSYDLDECFGSRSSAKGIFNQSEGPQQKGRPPANDTPEGAVPLALGGHANQQTKAAVLHPEASCTVFFDFEEENGDFDLNGEFELPIGKTVWYTVEGTGNPITVSTAGSQFDTIVGIYTADSEGGIEQVACVDDVFNGGFSLQAAVTFDTDPKVTYFIQAGGFGLFEDPEFPEFDSPAEYGLLKVSVTG